LAQRAVEAGFFLGVDGPLTYPRSDPLRDLVAALPLDHWLLETDCPYLAPQPVRGRRNEPAYLGYIAEALAHGQGVSLEEVARRTTANACRLFPGLKEALER
jgi:TatD DNase family protein